MSDKPHIDEKVLEAAKARILRFQQEAFGELMARMPFGAKFTLVTDGVEREARIEFVGDPMVKDDGTLAVMLDVAWDGGHIEYTLEQSGWGGMVPIDEGA